MSSETFDPACLRRVANWTTVKSYHKFDKSAFNPEKVESDLAKFSPKIFQLLQNIKELDEKDMKEHGKVFKHFIFSDVKSQGAGAKVCASSLVASGFNLIYDDSMKIMSDDKLLKTKYNNFVLLSSTSVFDKTINAKLKKEILTKFNQRPDNVYGELCRIIIADGGFKEGVDMFDVKYTHILEPQLSKADLRQAIGRTTRLCGQKGLEFHPTKGWPLNVYMYDVKLPADWVERYGEDTLFKLYLKYYNIDLRKLELVNQIEAAAIHGSVDYELNKAVHRFELGSDEGYDLEWLFPSKGGAVDDIDCKKKCGSRPTKKVPVGTPVMVAVYFSMNEKIPNLRSKDAKPRLFFCEILKKDTEYCARIRQAWKDPNAFIKKYRKEIAMSIFSREYIKLPQYTREQYLRLVNYALPGLIKRKKSGPREDSPLIKEEDKEMEEKKEEENEIETEEFEKARTIRPLNKLGFLEVRNYVRDNYSQFTWPKVKLENLCVPSGHKGGESSIVSFTPTQDFVRHFFTPSSPQKGMLLFHSVGTGKTCCAIATATSSFEKEGYTILWVTRSSLKSDIWKNMYDQICSIVIQEKIKNGMKMPGDMASRMRLLSKSWSIRPMSYKQFSNLVSGKNKFYEDLVKKNGKEDPLKKTLLIIDEAHKLYGGADLSSVERPDMNKLNKAIQHSYKVSGDESVKVLMMTGTPITNDPMELVKLVNICKPNNEQIEEDFDEFSKKYLDEYGKFTRKGKWAFLNEIAGYISYLSRERDARQFSQPILQNVLVNMSYPDYDLTSEKLEELQETVDKYKQHKLVIKNDMKDIKSKYKDEIKSIRAKCKELKKDDKKHCLELIPTEIMIAEKNMDRELDEKENEINKVDDLYTVVKKELMEEKKLLKNDGSIETSLLKKCLKKPKNKRGANSDSNSNSDRED